MKKSLKFREVIGDARRIVVKLGSRVLVQKNGRPDTRRIRHLVGQIADIHAAGREVVVVTSGAVGSGMEALGMTSRPSDVPDQQMCAAVGQARLMARYSELFGARGILVGQVLLTHEDFTHTLRLTNAHRTLDNLIRHRVVPVINENDVVADEEIKADLVIGDNDYLAALVVRVIRADLLVMLTSADGVREWLPNGRSRRLRYIETINRATHALVAPPQAGGLSKGGMGSKLDAAQMASKAGCTVVIANGRQPDVVERVMRGLCVGTIIPAAGI